jgi:hypothetical protein
MCATLFEGATDLGSSAAATKQAINKAEGVKTYEHFISGSFSSSL